MSTPEPSARSCDRAARRALVAAAVLAAGALLVLNTALARQESLGEMHSSWRYWDDMALAADLFLSSVDPADSPRNARARASLDDAVPAFRALVEGQGEQARLRPWEPWRTLPSGPIRRTLPPLDGPEFEDGGRAAVLALGFRSLDGVSPYLGVWIAVIVALPVVFWCAFELHDAGMPVAAVAFAGLVALSPYFVECLSLPHSAIGFYLIGLLALGALATYALLGRCRSRAGFVVRLTVAAGCFALAAVCRSGSVAFLPAFGLAIHAARRRVFGLPEQPPAGRLVSLARGWRGSLVLLSLFVVPFLLVRPARTHNVWLGFWEGLGDFGADRGYFWHDGYAQASLRRAGLEPFANPRLVTATHERFFRERFLDDVLRHPFWYARVLAQRTGATLGLTHLWPWGPLDGESLRTPRFHYRYTTPVDWIGGAGRAVELPVVVLLLPALILAAAFWSARRRSQRERMDALARRGGAAGLVALAALPIPVLISTASALETQAIAVSYFLLASFCLDDLAVLTRNSRFAANTAKSSASVEAPASRLRP